ncbi:Crp/Fnr family transcriptional regulator [Croceibacterium aestuarii]|uniref:Crp/Fnr family transcriptional regulator n=1 Tax=Croceibacterium aestuarii TaxID=3064139 RepID=UPI00272EA973|nr:Crp/Fnr family transcriptional regulator [Croceibacterium sp. D39]
MSSNHPQRRAIAALDLFGGLPKAALEEVIACARIQTLARGARVFDQGEPIERAHALLSGAVRISQTGSDGGEVVIRFIGPGEVFGSVAIFTDHCYPADGTVMVESTEVSWARAELLDLIARHPQIAFDLVKIAGRRLEELQERVREMATQRVDRRIANALLRLARQAGITSDRGTQIVFPLRRKDIAEISGTTLHTVSRTLNNWRRRGLVIDDKLGLILTSPEALEQATE